MSFTVDSAGILQYFVYDAAGNNFAAPKSPGIITGGASNVDYDTIRNEGINNAEAFFAGLNRYEPDVKGNYGPDAKAFLAKAIRTAGVIPAIDAKFGTTQQGWICTTGIIDVFELTVGEDQAPMQFSASVKFPAGTPSTGAVSDAALTGSPYASFNHVTTIGGTDYGVKSIKFKIMNNVETGSTGSAKSAGSLRDSTYILAGREQHEIEVVTLSPVATVGAGVDSPSQAIALVSVLGGATTLTYSNLAFAKGSFNQEFKVKGVVRFKHKLIGKVGALTLT